MDTKNQTTEKVEDKKQEEGKKETRRVSYATKASLDKYKKEVDKKVDVLNSLIVEYDKSLSSRDDNIGMLVESLNSISTRLDKMDKEINNIKSMLNNVEQSNIDVETLTAKVDGFDEDLGDLIDKVDVLFVGDSADSDDIRSKVEKLERAIYGRLHKRA